MHPIYPPTEQELNLIQGFNFEELKTLSPQESGREKWLKQRQGKFTASNIHKLLTCENKIELPKGAISYIEEVAIEILTDGQSREDFTSEAMQHGQETELKAIARFEKETGFFCYNTGEKQEFIQHNKYFGGTPDGLIDHNALIEIKCPKPKTHFFNLLNLKSAEDVKKHYKEYYWQIQANLFITGRTQGVFVSYDDRFLDQQKQIVIVEVPYCREDVSFMLFRLELAVEYLEKLMNRQQAIGSRTNPYSLKKIKNMQTFEKITKKFALSNSYFKNKRPQDPQNPFQVLEYYQQHRELPYKEAPHKDWFYECFIEYQKKNTIVYSQYFTPTKTAQQMAQILSFYANEQDKILEACCGFGQITKALIEKGFKNIAGFDIDKEMVEVVNYFHGNEAHFFTADFTNYFEKDLPYKTYDFVICNPPYEVKELTLFFGWLSQILNTNGKAVLLIAFGFVDKTTKQLKQALSHFRILERQPMQEEFARTKIKAEIVVLERL